MKEFSFPIPPSDRYFKDECYRHEWVRRVAVYHDKISRGGSSQVLQESLTRFGRAMQNERWNRTVSASTLASQLSIAPEMLCFLESGFVHPDELLAVAEKWLSILGTDLSLLEEITALCLTEKKLT